MSGMKDSLGDTLYGSVYPLAPGLKAGGTSQEAAKSMGLQGHVLRDRVYEAICASGKGLTADEAASLLKSSVLAIRPRCSELVKLGLIKDSCARRRNYSQRRAVVWEKA